MEVSGRKEWDNDHEGKNIRDNRLYFVDSVKVTVIQ